MVEFTLIQSKNPLNKLFKSNGEKVNRGQMYNGVFKKAQIQSIKQLFELFNKFESNQAITLGITQLDEGEIVTSKHVSENKIARTKKFFT